MYWERLLTTVEAEMPRPVRPPSVCQFVDLADDWRKHAPTSAHWALHCYAAGLYPVVNPTNGRKEWHGNSPVRGTLPLAFDHTFQSRSLRRALLRRGFRVTFDQDFEGVLSAIAAKPDSWLAAPVIGQYLELFDLGFCHSVEVWSGAELVGGLFVTHVGASVTAHSMFSRCNNAGNTALFYLAVRLRLRRFALLDLQGVTPHTRRLGAVEIPREEFIKRLEAAIFTETCF